MHLARQFLYRLAASLKVFQEKGFQAGFMELGQTILRIFFQRSEHVIIARVLSEGEIPPVDAKPGFVIHQLKTYDEIASLSPIVDLYDIVRFRKMFDRGSIVFGAFQDDQPAGCCWISEEVDFSVNRVQPPLRRGDACVHDLFVSPAYRRQGIGQKLVSHRLRFLRENGYRRAIGAVLKDNTAALSVDKKTGYMHIGEMSHTRILFWDRFNYELSDSE